MIPALKSFRKSFFVPFSIVTCVVAICFFLSYFSNSVYAATVFTDETAAYGLEDGTPTHTSSSWVDVNNDGLLDLYSSAYAITNHLYLNAGVGSTFPDATSTYGIGDSTTNHIAANWVDFDNDGDLDLYVSNYGANNHLYLNNGVGEAFTDVTSTYDLASGTSAHAGATWIDINEDGLLDLYVFNDGSSNYLYINNGVGEAFTDETNTYGISAGAVNRLAASWGDVNNDGRLDLYASNYGANNRLYINNGPDVSFSDETTTYGLADGTALHLGAAFVDVNGDGLLDIYTLSSSSNNHLYINNGPDVSFTDETSTYGLADGTDKHDSAQIIDINNDGLWDISLVVASSSNHMFINNGSGAAFTDAVADYGLSNGTSSGKRVSSWVDFDNDGDLDMHAPIIGANNKFYVNPGQGNNFLKVVVNDSSGNYLYHTRVEVDVDGNGDFSSNGTLEVNYQSGSSYGGAMERMGSQDPVGIFFGLGSDSSCKADVRIFLPGVSPSSSPSYSYTDVCPNQSLIVGGVTISIDSFSSYTTDTTPLITGTAASTKDAIASVSYQVDSATGSWTSCTSDDGSFDEVSEDFSCDISTALSEGSHVVYIKAVDDYGLTSIVAVGSNSGNLVNFGVDISAPRSFDVVTSGDSKYTYVVGGKTKTADFVGDGESSNEETVAVSWYLEGDENSNVDRYEIYIREKGSSKWRYAGFVYGDTDYFVFRNLDDGEYEWYVKAIDAVGFSRDSKTYTFRIDSTVPDKPTITAINGHPFVFDYMSIPQSQILRVEGISKENTEIVVEIWDPEGIMKYQEIECSADTYIGDGRSRFVCEDASDIRGSYLLKVYTRSAGGNSSVKVTFTLKAP